MAGKHTYKWLTRGELNRLMRAVKRKKLGFINPVFDVEEVEAMRCHQWSTVRNNRTPIPGKTYFHATLTYD